MPNESGHAVRAAASRDGRAEVARLRAEIDQLNAQVAQLRQAAAGQWRRGHTAAVVLIVVGVVAVGVLLPREMGRAGGYEHARLAAWVFVLALLGAFGAVVGHGLTGLWRGILVDSRNRVSLARAQMFLWTIVVLSAYLSAALSNVGLGASAPLEISVPQALWLVMGVSTASLAASPAVRRLGRERKLDTKTAPQQSQWRDAVRGEDEGAEASPDLGKIQLVFFTVVLVLAYCVVIANAFDVKGQIVTGLPKIDDAFLILLTISHGGYLAKKAQAPSGKG